MHIFILETGEPPAPLTTQFGVYPDMFERILTPLGSQFSFSRLSVHKENPPPRPNGFDGLLITGSPASVYEEREWIAESEKLVRATAEAEKPIVGICFGHQLIAQAFGGRVEKSAKGWGVGAHSYDIKALADWMTPSANRISCAVAHQDQVIEPPEGARILGGSDFCPNGIIEYSQGPAISFQSHPEFSYDYAGALMTVQKDRIPADRIETGLQSIKARSDRELLARWIANFFFSNKR